MHLQVAVEERQSWCKCDMLRQTLLNTSRGDREGSVADSYEVRLVNC